MANLTAKQIEALALVNEGAIKGACERYVWRFGTYYGNYTAQIRALEKRGLIHIMYHRSNEASVNLTDEGRAVV